MKTVIKNRNGVNQPDKESQKNMSVGPYLAIDFGDARTGLALGDEEGLIASPLKVIHEKNHKRLAQVILEECQERGIQTLILGLPLSMDGKAGKRVQQTYVFADSLRELGAPEIIFEDERLSSWQAEKDLVDAGIYGEKRKERVDALAARQILENYFKRFRKIEAHRGDELSFLNAPEKMKNRQRFLKRQKGPGKKKFK